MLESDPGRFSEVHGSGPGLESPLSEPHRDYGRPPGAQGRPGRRTRGTADGGGGRHRRGNLPAGSGLGPGGAAALEPTLADGRRAAAEKVDDVTPLMGTGRRLTEQLSAVETALRGTQHTLDGLVSLEAALRAESAIELRQRVATLDDPAGTPEDRLHKAGGGRTGDGPDRRTEQTDIDATKEELAIATST